MNKLFLLTLLLFLSTQAFADTKYKCQSDVRTFVDSMAFLGGKVTSFDTKDGIEYFTIINFKVYSQNNIHTYPASIKVDPETCKIISSTLGSPGSIKAFNNGVRDAHYIIEPNIKCYKEVVKLYLEKGYEKADVGTIDGINFRVFELEDQKYKDLGTIKVDYNTCEIVESNIEKVDFVQANQFGPFSTSPFQGAQ